MKPRALKPAHIAAVGILLAGAVWLALSAHAADAHASSSAATQAHIVLADKDAAPSFENVQTPADHGGKTPDRRK